mmetsp:Transcript_9869/g.17823  ORF Transcript_9869/g.17823 Transcript_9869/m.17823 type:complete len:295 (-) Transcript_9869:1292-2176(-)
MRAAGASLICLLESYLLIYGYCYSLHPKSKSHRATVQARAESLSKRRRDVIISSIGVASSSLLPPWQTSLSSLVLPYSIISPAYADEKIPSLPIISTREAAHYIHRYSNPEFVSSVVKSNYNFLYRGLSVDESEAVVRNNLAAIMVKDEPHDLLDPDTYQSNEAVSYFRSLEKDMIANGLSIKPSNGHIATTCPKEAARWGAAVSIWPLGEKGVDFAWLEDGGMFWPINGGGRGKSRSVVTTSTSISDIGDKGALSEALQGDTWDVMFRADNGFLAVSAELDNELRTYLMKMEK